MTVGWLTKSAPNAFNRESVAGDEVRIVLADTGEMVQSRFHKSDKTRANQPKFWLNGKPASEQEVRTAGVELKPVNDLVFNGVNAETKEPVSLWMRPSAKDPLFSKVRAVAEEAGDDFQVGGTLVVKLVTSKASKVHPGNDRTWDVKYLAPVGIMGADVEDAGFDGDFD
jgi:hypothetical protein